MKVKYIGEKKLLSVPLPIGNKRRPKETLDFTPGKEHELKKEDAELLVKIGQGFFELSGEEELAEEKPKKKRTKKKAE